MKETDEYWLKKCEEYWRYKIVVDNDEIHIIDIEKAEAVYKISL